VELSELKNAVDAAWAGLKPKPFDPARPVVKLHEATYDADEIWEFLNCLLRTEVTMGAKVRRFEGEFGQKLGYGHSVMVNSGSSANLLAVSALTNPLVDRHLRPGDEVIVPALCWSTTVWPLIQHQLVPVVVDADPRTLNIDVAQVAQAIGPKTRAIMPVHIYGNPCDMDGLMDLVRKYDLTLIEDSCESLGATYRGKSVGSFGRVGTFSFYYSHHITTLEGGMVVTDDFQVAEALRVLRAHGWVREMAEPQKHLAANPEIHPKFLFVNLGYNLRATEPQGAMGSLQLTKLDRFIDIRTSNAEFWKKDFASLGDCFQIQETTPHSKHSWFGFPMRMKPGLPFSRKEFFTYLQERGIEMRPLNAGNIAAQPALKHFPHRIVGNLAHANAIMKDGFTFGNHQHVDDAARRYISSVVKDFVAASRKRA